MTVRTLPFRPSSIASDTGRLAEICGNGVGVFSDIRAAEYSAFVKKRKESATLVSCAKPISAGFVIDRAINRYFVKKTLANSYFSATARISRRSEEHTSELQSRF